jgi:hypothetical protein
MVATQFPAEHGDIGLQREKAGMTLKGKGNFIF